MTNYTSTDEIKELYDLYRQYDVIEPWLESNGFKLSDLPLTAKTADGEDVIIEQWDDDEDGNPIFALTYLQHNGWARVNYLYKDGTIEELYHR